MRVVDGFATVEDVDEFVATLSDLGDEHDCVIQAFDARYVVDEAHLETAVDRAARAWRRDDAIAHDPGVEVLLYAAGRRQISQALELGVGEGEAVPVVAVVVSAFPDDPFETDVRETAAVDALADVLRPGDVLGSEADAGRIRSFFDVTDAELAATDATLSELVRERVSLLVVDK
ncbi:KEOPS complex subunit Cgi121 [Haloarchaeobius sp. HRN-SO-5]|uniref:KEOPS complex subunit Cgi121 n=1 Tax=Haloarchaeobius sp. HRN-SO-5 TaxID=3446118 RepID=UPI003EBED903